MKINRARMFAGTFVASLAIVSATQVFPHILRMFSPLHRIPYAAESVFMKYKDDGSATVESYTTSYQQDGKEIVLSEFIPGHPFQTGIRRALDTFGFVTSQVIQRLGRRSEQPKTGAATPVKNDCSAGSGRSIGRETILNYPTIVVQRDMGRQRMTLWVAPDLGCFAMKLAIEERRPDGNFRLRLEKKTLNVRTGL